MQRLGLENAMTDEKKFKKQIRARMERTGESYSTARRALDGSPDDADATAAEAPRDAVATGDLDQLVAELRAAMTAIRTWMETNTRAAPGALEHLGVLGLAIHRALAQRGQEPRHRKGFVEGRARSIPPAAPGTALFYAHFNSAASLLRFVDDPVGANIDPPDVTLGSEFAMKIYGRRWQHRDTFHVTRTADGWAFRYMGVKKQGGRDARVGGAPGTGLCELLDRETINYPEELPGYFEYLWESGADGLDQAGVQAALADLAEWISECEARSPRGVFTDFK